VAAAGIGAGDLVLDVGAGTGAITVELLAAGAHVVALELHPTRARILRERFVSAPVTVVQADAADLRLPRRPFKVVANPPFAITASLLRRLTSPGSRLVSADVVLPRHVASRWAEGRAPGADRWRALYAAQLTRRLPASAFAPPARGVVAVLRVERRAGR
jgi:23S rRNA (adenine-N6)-dimethyltransferase